MHKIISFKKQNIGGRDHNSFNWMNSLSTQLGNLVKPLVVLMCIFSLILNEDESSSDGLFLLTMAAFTMSPFYFTALYVAMSGKGALAAPVGDTLENGLVLSRDLRGAKGKLKKYANALTFEELMEDINSHNPSALRLQNEFDRLINKYVLFYDIDITNLRDGISTVVLDRIPENPTNWIIDPYPLSNMLIDNHEMQLKLKKMIDQFQKAYQVNGTVIAKFAKTNSSSIDEELEKVLNKLGISDVVNPTNEKLAYAMSTNYCYKYLIKGSYILGLWTPDTFRDESISVLTQNRSTNSIMRTLEHEFAHWLGMKHIPEKLIEELEKIGMCSLFSADSLICPNLFELSIFDLYLLNQIAKNAADPNFEQPVSGYISEKPLWSDKAKIWFPIGGGATLCLFIWFFRRDKSTGDNEVVDASTLEYNLTDNGSTPSDLSFIDNIGGIEHLV